MPRVSCVAVMLHILCAWLTIRMIYDIQTVHRLNGNHLYVCIPVSVYSVNKNRFRPIYFNRQFKIIINDRKLGGYNDNMIKQ